jgi:hypothetical protein
MYHFCKAKGKRKIKRYYETYSVLLSEYTLAKLLKQRVTIAVEFLEAI